jgi:predicted  nucleic acid-binding Zn-ribbon protein
LKVEASVRQIRALVHLAKSNGAEDAQGNLPRTLLERYDALIAAGRVPAVVAIEQGTCSGCHLRLPTMVDAMARRAPAVHVCPHCRRMLYVPELLQRDPHADKRAAAR